MDEIDVAGNLSAVKARVSAAAARSGRDPDSIALLAVSKTKPESLIRAAFRAGQRQFGENYVQEGVAKVVALADLAIDWHFIGPLQSNKTRAVAEHFSWVHTVDREKIARRLAEQRPEHLPPLNLCLQVNISGEASKSGVAPDELPELAAVVSDLPNLRLRGLMAIPAPASDPEAQRAPLAKMHELYEQLRVGLTGFDTLSMGMSGDLEAAVTEGSTLVRVGTDIFGARSPQSHAR